jgi:hypothetical protein
MAGFRSRVADVLSAIKGSTIEPQSVNTDKLSTSQGTVWDQSSNDFVDLAVTGSVEVPSDVTSTSFTRNAQASGVFDLSKAPNGVSVYGRFIARTDEVDSEVTVVPRVTILPSNSFVNLSELEVTGTSNDEVLDSGWTEITTTDELINHHAVESKVDSGEASFSTTTGLAIGWRLD